MSVFLKFLRFILCCSEEDHHDYGTLERDSLHGRSYYNSSVSNSSRNNHDLLRSHDPNKIYYYEYYPNESISSPTLKKPQQSGYDNKLSLNATNEVSQSLKSTRPLPPSSSYYTCPSSPQSLPKLKPSPSSPSLSSSTQHSSFSDSQNYSSKSSFSPPKAPQSSTRSSSKPLLSPGGPVPSSFTTPSSSIPKPAIPSSKASSSLSTPASSPLCQSDLTPVRHYDYYPNLPTSSSTTKRHSDVPLQSESSNKSMEEIEQFVERLGRLKNSCKPKPSVPEDTSASSKPCQSPTEPPQSSAKPTTSPLRTNPTNRQTKADYTVVQKDTSSLYKIPKDIECMIKKDIVPDVLKKPLSPYTYKDYFAALLYAEDFYIEKWSDFQLLDVTLELHDAAIYDKSQKNKNLKKSNRKDTKTFVGFEIDYVPERRPFLLSRDFVHARRSGSKAKEFQGILYQVVKSNKVLVEFEENFYSQHHPKNRYDISFSFNRVCLKRAHEAIAAVSNPLFQNHLFPDSACQTNIPSPASQLYSNHKVDSDSNSAVRRILSCQGRPPYLVEGPLCVTIDELSKTGLVVREAVLKTYTRSSKCRILVCAPINRTGDILMRSLKKEIPESDMFRANAAFREVDGVPVDILPLCLYGGGECFSLPSLLQLMQFKVIFSTFVSSFRLHSEGIPAGHFSHIFLVDASSATEPETMIALTNFAIEETTVIVTGAPSNHTSWVRSDIARKYGLRMSYFERLCATKTYSSSDPKFITAL